MANWQASLLMQTLSTGSVLVLQRDKTAQGAGARGQLRCDGRPATLILGHRLSLPPQGHTTEVLPGRRATTKSYSTIPTAFAWK